MTQIYKKKLEFTLFDKNYKLCLDKYILKF